MANKQYPVAFIQAVIYWGQGNNTTCDFCHQRSKQSLSRFEDYKPEVHILSPKQMTKERKAQVLEQALLKASSLQLEGNFGHTTHNICIECIKKVLQDNLTQQSVENTL